MSFFHRSLQKYFEMSILFAVILGGIAAGVAFTVVATALVWSYKHHFLNSGNKNSETGSSDPPSALGELNTGCRVPSNGTRPLRDGNEARPRIFTLEELEQATKKFNECNLVGHGSFGLVYKGLLCDGTVVAIKRRVGTLHQEFVKEVNCLSVISHRNLVSLIGYCQEGGLQMLVFEYLPNGSLSDHLYDTDKELKIKLEFKQRLSVAIGAAKGLSHLHSIVPPLVHRNFKTSNVLVDENFIAKVADAGIIRFIQNIEDVGTSEGSHHQNIFRDPEIKEDRTFSGASDVYSFGVFLLELVTGQIAAQLNFIDTNASLIQWVKEHLNSGDLIDRRLAGSLTTEGMTALIKLTLQCLSLTGSRRPTMDVVGVELHRILETEMTLTTIMGDGTAIVTLGSQLFA
ncbi:probable serine/threonine-protein kinase PBL28 isoform X1 [Dioscorea cayenensis subsp. rotundata]|uniref:non-specific serine/threonine protein kinase n=2 Tax=Dioscorea cayennensis subsp. rotundata TaxID=55577 RepID=A0AB40D4K5_DIOCR|nr:probable serine/threonine-protein kinase PBL28 isoform X1 [Dioscorea cayenensis subsp. rotundata]